MKEKQSELKPCPFCGGEARPFAKDYNINHDKDCILEDNFSWIVKGGHKEKAWNRRA